jgi:hypothetical protein
MGITDSGKWDQESKIKIPLAESLISSSLLFHDKTVKNADEMSVLTLKTLESIANFYNHVFPELATSSKTLFGRKKTPIELAERIIEKRVDLTSEHGGNFWTQFFHNSVLFHIFIWTMDSYKCRQDRSRFFKYEREELRTCLVKVTWAAAHANNTSNSKSEN